MMKSSKQSELENEKLRWYVIKAQAKRERIAAKNIHARYGLEVFCPQIKYEKSTLRGKVLWTEALFPGYFFARFDLAMYYRQVCYAQGVIGRTRSCSTCNAA